MVNTSGASNTKYTKLPQSEKDKPLKSNRKKTCLKTMLKGGVILMLAAVLLALCSSIFADGFSFTKFSYPLHASCKVDWDFGINCSSVSEALISQMKEWSGPENCKDGGEKCLYKIVFSNSTTLSGTHETPVKHYVDDISFQFNQQSSGCQVKGFSTSETWYAYLDYGTNYCNLHNLITGSGLDKSEGYKETTNDDICTQYSSADCEKY